MTGEPETPPQLIAIGGFSGSGKTTLAAALQKRLPNAVHLDSDSTRKEIFGVAETVRLPPEAYTPAATGRVIAEMERRVKMHSGAGRTVIMSALFSPASSRDEVKKLAAQTGARFAGIWLHADLKILLDRVEKRTNNVSDAGGDIVKRQIAEETEAVLWPTVDAAWSFDEVVAAARRIIGV